ncbi:hypothetical protein MMC20_004209, partial [Loxospora ochrophaea]|nr:hypothetical protein [Loxospora ochrophaea]
SETYQYKKLDVAGERYQTVSISVPSRLAFRASSKQAPLAGLRFAVKDLYRMNGLKTSLCNQAYLDVSDQADYTASAVAAFTRAGAQILGMTKLSSLISREEPTEGIDYQIPFNPRGDGYQSPAGSSNGSAAAVAAYDWLDFSLGTDTSGSGRRPALANGVFQLRPTHDAINLDGIVPTFLPWDTPCLFSRDVAMIKQLASVWYISDMPPTKFHKPPAIIYPLDYFPVPNPAQMIIIEGFISDLEKHLGITISKVSLSSLWDIAPPQEAGQQSVKDYLRSTVVNTYYHDFYHSTDNFRAKYRSIYKKEPYVTPFNQWRWNLGKRVSPSQNESGLHQLSVYKRWFLDVVMKRETHESLLLLPVANVEPNYRDSTPPEPIIQHGFDPLFIPPILGSPDLFVPLDDSEYMSRVSGKKEFLPVGIDLVGTPGADLTLIETVQGCLTVSGRSTQVLTGARMFGPCH